MRAEQLPYLETFIAAAERSSFTAAALALALSQAAVSQHIQALEKELGAALFQRRGGRVLLTDAGRRLHEYAQRILLLHQEARQEITGRRAAVTGELSLAASSIPGEHLLPGLLAAFRKKHPHIQVRATVADSQAVIADVEHGRVHLGLVGKKEELPHLEYRCFACDTLMLIAPARGPWRRRRRISLDDLARQPLILREAGSGSRWCFEQALSRADWSLRRLRVALELGSNEAIKEAVLQGLGLAVLSTRAVEKELHSKKLHAMQISGLPLLREMFVAWDRRRALPIPARLFLDLLEPCGGRKSAHKRRL